MSRSYSEFSEDNPNGDGIGRETWTSKLKMSADEDTELRDLVAQTLESKGVLGKIRVR